MNDLVEIYELEERLDGTVGIGNSFLVPMDEAVKRIRNKEAKAASAPIGVVPENWE